MSTATPSSASNAQNQGASASESTEISNNDPQLTSINNNIVQEKDIPSPLTMPSLPSEAQSSNNNTREELVSIRCVSFVETENGNHLSVPQQPASVPLTAADNPYESDGEEGPFFDAVLNELDYCSSDEEDDELPQSTQPMPQPVLPSTLQPGEPVTNSAAEQPGTSSGLTEDEVNKMSVNQLKEELRKRNKATTGVKKVLQQRLLQDCHPGVVNAPVRTTESTENGDEAVPGFAPGAKWVLLKAKTTATTEPMNANSNLVGPTVPDGEKEKDKYDFDEEFDRPPFVAMSRVVETLQSGKVAKDRKGNIKWTEEIRSKGRANINWVEAKGLTEFSTPSSWFEALLPEKRKPSDPRSTVCLADWTTYTNTKALLLNAGQPGYLYPEWIPFSVSEVKKFIGLYIFQGLSPSPQLKMKFKPQSIDPINGSDLCWSLFGANAEKRHKHFKCFFSVQNPLLPTPSKATHPNWKIDPFLAWVQTISMAAWDVGSHLSGDEQTIGFKGNHADKQRINYKKEGDGFLADAIAEDGYTYTFFLRNMPAPKKYIDMKMSPLHSRVLFMFDQLKEKNCTIGLDNLYISTKFVRQAFVGKNSVMVHSVARKSGRGLPKVVVQEEIKNAKEAEKVRGTTKAAVLEGDPDCPQLVAFSVYDTKPVHFLSMAATSLKWIEKSKRFPL